MTEQDLILNPDGTPYVRDDVLKLLLRFQDKFERMKPPNDKGLTILAPWLEQIATASHLTTNQWKWIEFNSTFHRMPMVEPFDPRFPATDYSEVIAEIWKHIGEIATLLQRIEAKA